MDYLRIEQGLSEAYNRISKNINELNTIKCEVAKKFIKVVLYMICVVLYEEYFHVMLLLYGFRL